jgi:uncharacterized C2H2 Zn-finger protein
MYSLDLDEFHIQHRGGMVVMPAGEFSGLAKVVKVLHTAFDRSMKPDLPGLSTADIEALRCPFCGKSFPKVGGLKKHYKTAHSPEERFFCPDEGCECSYSTKRALDVHILKWGGSPLPHKAVRKYLCKVVGCGLEFDAFHEVVAHTAQAHPNAPAAAASYTFQCPHCGGMKQSKRYLADHVSGCAKNPGCVPVPCGFKKRSGCERMFRRPKDLNWHMKTVHNWHKGMDF